MGLRPNILERQLENAKARLDACEQSLSASENPPEKFKRHPEWRRRSAAYRQIKRRMLSCAAWRPPVEPAEGEADG